MILQTWNNNKFLTLYTSSTQQVSSDSGTTSSPVTHAASKIWKKYINIKCWVKNCLTFLFRTEKIQCPPQWRFTTHTQWWCGTISHTTAGLAGHFNSREIYTQSVTSYLKKTAVFTHIYRRRPGTDAQCCKGERRGDSKKRWANSGWSCTMVSTTLVATCWNCSAVILSLKWRRSRT